MKVLITGLDLEQLEHRGIAVYTNNVIRALDELGHDVWLLTQHQGLQAQRRLRSTLAKNVVSLLARTTLMEALDVGGVNPDQFNVPSKRAKLAEAFVGFFTRIFHTLSRSERHIADIYQHVFPKKNYVITAKHLVPLTDHPLTPYAYVARLGYLKHLTGIVAARNIFQNSMRLQARGKRDKVTIRTNQFDIFLTTCPLGITTKGIPSVQTIHDTIPIELFKTTDNPITFAHRLANAGPNHIFVSKESKRRYDFFYEKVPSESIDTIVHQPPSLYSSLFRTEGDDVELKLSRLEDLRLPRRIAPLRYILFNSKVEYRKNLEFLVQAYLGSSLRSEGISLVICGGLNQDLRTSQLRELTGPYEDTSLSANMTSSSAKVTSSHADRIDPGHIVFTGYVDDHTRDTLFTAALAVVSPSIIEGFGIPVLDAAALGVPVVASDIGSHIEIHSMYDFDNYVHLRSLHSLSGWIQKLNDISSERSGSISRSVQQKLLDKAEINMRLKRFVRMRRQIWGQFKEDLSNSLMKARL
ncbi:glycosyltransferase [Synechococcus sp. GFB01]|uniref:glycosyltransferase n=1 Tax=Synechococcus sp. GFB01 TaxID=1662190 RepID=UPI0009EC9471|nr:glycosyltransferase [Synechococcus sp. GFB01]